MSQYNTSTPVEATPPAIAFTLLDCPGAVLTKRYALSDNGKPEKAGNAQHPTHGTARRAMLEGSPSEMLECLRGVLDEMSGCQAIVCAPPPDGRSEWRFTVKERADRGAGSIARTKDDFVPRAGPALLGLDFDVKDYPADMWMEMQARGGLDAILVEAFPAFEGAALLRRPSSSSFIRCAGSSGEPELRGEHRYYIIPEGTDAAAFAQRLAQRLKLNGWAWAKVNAAGKALPRNPLDAGASDPSRIFYEADAEIGAGLEYGAPRRSEVTPGGMLVTAMLPEVTDEEAADLRAIEQRAKQAVREEADRVWDARTERRFQKLVGTGVPEGQARAAVRHYTERQELSHFEEIQLDSGEVVSVDEILCDRDRYHRKTCAMPFEPEYGGGKNLAIIYTDGEPHIFGQGHGGVDFKLCANPARFFDIENPLALPGEEQVAVASGPLRLNRLAWADLEAIPPRPWLYGRKVLRGYVTFIASPGGVGKTAFVTAMSLACLTGEPLLGDAPVAPLNVWILNLEDDLAEMRRRVKAAMDHYGVDREVLQRLGVNSGRDRRFCIVKHGKDDSYIVQPDFDGVIAEIRRNRVDLLIVDPFLRSHSVPENDNAAQDEVMRLYAQIAHETGAGVVLLHHVKKGAVAGDMDGLRGGSTQAGGARSVLTLSPMSVEEAKKLGIEESQRRLHVRIDDAKNNMAPPMARAEWIRLASVPLRNGTPDHPEGDFVQVATRFEMPGAWDGLPEETEAEMLAVLEAGMVAEGAEAERYSKRPQDARWAGHMLVEQFGRTEAQAKEILAGWETARIIEVRNYVSGRQRKPRKGIFVVSGSTARACEEMAEGVFG